MTKLTWFPCKDEYGAPSMATQLGTQLVVAEVVYLESNLIRVFGVTVYNDTEYHHPDGGHPTLNEDASPDRMLPTGRLEVESVDAVPALVEPLALDWAYQEVNRLARMLHELKRSIPVG